MVIHDNIKFFCREVKDQELKHSTLYHSKKLIPRPSFFKKFLKETPEKYRPFFDKHRKQIEKEDWNSWKNYTYEYIAELERMGIYEQVINEKYVSNSQLNTERHMVIMSQIYKSSKYTPIEILENLGNEDMKKYLVENVFNHSTIEIFRSIVHSIFEDEMAKVKIFSFASEVKKIGEESSFGIAYKALIGNYNKYKKEKLANVVLKFPRNSSGTDLIHEAALGLTLNNIRSKCVNFCCIYDIFIGTEFIFSEGGNVLSSLYDTKKIPYLVMEMVNNAKPISSVKTKEELLLYVTQGVLGLKQGFEEYNFCHFDCHDGNTLLYEYSEEPFYIKYDNFYIKSMGKIVMFIDYGMSYIYIKETNTHLGNLDWTGKSQSKGTFNDMSNPVGDIFKLLLMILRTVQFDDDLSSICCQLIDYFFQCRFSLDDFHYVHNECWHDRYTLRPEISNFHEWTVEGFLNHAFRLIKENIADGIVYEEPENVLGKIDRSTQEQLQKIGISDRLEIVNALELYISHNNEELKDIFLNNIEKSLDNDYDRIKDDLDFYIDFSSYEPRFFLNISYKNLSILKSKIVIISDFIDVCFKLSNECTIMKNASKISEHYKCIYNDVSRKYNFLVKKGRLMRETLNHCLSNLKSTYNIGMFQDFFTFYNRENRKEARVLYNRFLTIMENFNSNF